MYFKTKIFLHIDLYFEYDYDPGSLDAFKFIRKYNNFKLPDLRTIEIRYMDCLKSKSLTMFNNVFSKYAPNRLKSLFLSGGDWCDLSKFHKIAPLLNSVDIQIYLLQFKISSKSLKWLLESSKNVKTLIMLYCEIMEIDQEFALSTEIDFKIE